MIRKNVFFKWKSISIYDESGKEIHRYELDENERLIHKMKRLKKRSFISTKLKRSEIDDKTIRSNAPNYASMKLEYVNQVIFSYQNKELDEKLKLIKAQQENINSINITLPSFTLDPFPMKPLDFKLPSLININQPSAPIDPILKDVIYITDISDDIRTSK